MIKYVLARPNRKITINRTCVCFFWRRGGGGGGRYDDIYMSVRENYVVTRSKALKWLYHVK